MAGASASARELVFFTHELCPFAERVALALGEAERAAADVRVHTVPIDLSAKPAGFRGLVPQLQLSRGGPRLTESAYLATIVAAEVPEARLAPETPEEAAAAERLLAGEGSFVSAGLQLLGGGWGLGGGSPRSPAATRMRGELRKLEAALERSGGPFLLGERLTTPDLTFYPFAHRFAMAAPVFAGGFSFDEEAPLVAAWVASVAARPAAQELRPADDEVMAAWKRTKRLDWFDDETASRAHPNAGCPPYTYDASLLEGGATNI